LGLKQAPGQTIALFSRLPWALSRLSTNYPRNAIERVR
jgi:hypothetical protein